MASVWEELLITPSEVEQRESALLVRGRVYLRSRALGIRDMPTAWIWDARGAGASSGARSSPIPEEAVEALQPRSCGQSRVAIRWIGIETRLR